MSANTGLLTYGSGVFNISSAYYSPSVVIPTTGEVLGTIYCFLSKVDIWADEINPPVPFQSQKELKRVMKNMFVAKKINSSDMSPITERNDWTTGTVYDYYDDNADMFVADELGIKTKKFYIRNRYDQVFKCLWNNNGAASTFEPYFEPGTYNKNKIYQAADGYKWKFMYTISAGDKLKFMDSAWIPVPLNSTYPNPVASTAGTGSIDVINVTDGGSGYDPSNAVVFITVTGDGSYASANAEISGGVITDIVVANTGINYTYANVEITSAIGSGAAAFAPASPSAGHGSDPVSELGCRHVMITCTFNKDESGVLPTDIDFRQLGLMVNPYAYFGSSVDLANSDIYNTSTVLSMSQGFGSYGQDEIVFQSEDYTLANASYTATSVAFNTSTNQLNVINTVGTPILNQVLIGNTTGTVRVLLQESQPAFIKNSGYIIYLENRASVQRTSMGSEQFRLVLGY